ncbi:MAG TPA: ABC transporter ATP-binding protein [Chloroflexota bacterium]|nr:ABC transporter ATP-binding protein [Chloroflexota bacterium]
MANRPASTAGEARLVAMRAAESARLAGMALRLAWSASRRLLCGIVVLIVLEAWLPLAQLALSKAVLDRIARPLQPALPVQDGSGPVPLLAALPLGGLIALAVFVVGASQLLPTLNATAMAMAGDRMTGYITGRLIRATSSWPGLARFEDPGVADDLHRARERTTMVGLDLVREGSYGATALLGAAGLGATLGALHPLAPLLILVCSLPQVVWQWRYLQATANSLYIRTPDSRRLWYYRDVTMAPEPAKDVRLYNLAPEFGRRYEATFRRTVDAMLPLYRRLTVRSALGMAIGAGATGAVYLYVVWLVAQGLRTLGDIALYGGAAAMLHGRLLSAGRMVSIVPRDMAFLPALNRVLHAPPDLPVPAHPRPVPRPIREGIVFHDVWFSYPGTPARQPAVLRGLKLALAPGESLALVGHNGAGKTTIVKLLLRFYDPTAGRITLDGIDLREYDLEALRRRTGVIFQDFVRYELTARENVAVGDLTALREDARLLAAAQEAGAAPLLETLPRGLDTLLGRRFGGRELSGGEWQKLALARVFLRARPSPPSPRSPGREGASSSGAEILVLDEPTAALDVPTEYEVYTRFQELTRGRTTLLISHRFSTVRLAQRILYLAEGTIQEHGTHAELLARGGEYARLYHLQASQYLGAAAGGVPARERDR